ncbi:MAG: PKD domain-containing protein, partial [Thermoplasmata archaeon]|nr:PKD domain-containing protein [Thermoplasmata archaeon]
MFRFVTTPGFAAAPSLQATVTCSSPEGPVPGCLSVPSREEANGSTVLAWNWSNATGHSALQFGDSWSASFNLVAAEGPSNATALDECATPECLAAENGSVPDLLSAVSFAVDGGALVVAESFPLRNLSIAAPANLSAAIHVPDATGDAPALVGFGVSTAGGYPPYVARWQFGDGTLANSSGSLNISHAYPDPGLYQVEVTVGDSAGATVRLHAWVTIFPAIEATVSPTNASGGAPLFVTFSATPSGGEGPYSVLWNFGNGSTAAGSLTYFTFVQPGSYDVQVEVSDAVGGTLNATVPVNVTPAATAQTPSNLSV